MTLHKEEKETIISWHEGSKEAIVFTYSKPIMKIMERKFGLKPIMTNDFGGKEYKIGKDRVKFNLPRKGKKKLTEEQRARLAKNLERGRATRKANGRK